MCACAVAWPRPGVLAPPSGGCPVTRPTRWGLTGLALLNETRRRVTGVSGHSVAVYYVCTSRGLDRPRAFVDGHLSYGGLSRVCPGRPYPSRPCNVWTTWSTTLPGSARRHSTLRISYGSSSTRWRTSETRRTSYAGLAPSSVHSATRSPRRPPLVVWCHYYTLCVDVWTDGHRRYYTMLCAVVCL